MPTFRSQSVSLQSALEAYATKGTEVTPQTVRHVFETIKITPTDKLYRPKLALGILLANQTGEMPVQRGVDWSLSGPVVLNQFHYYTGMAVQGTVTKSGGSDPYTWTMTRNATADPLLHSRSFTYQMTDGTTPSPFKFLYAMATKMSLQGSDAAPVTFTLDGFARRLQAGTTPTSLAFPVIESPQMAQTTVYIDGSWTTPSAAVALQVLGWKFTIETGVTPLDTADARSDLDFALDEIDVGKVKISAELLCLVKSTALPGVWVAEKTAAEAATLRQITIKSAYTANHYLQIRALMKYEAGSLFPDGDKDGLQTVNLKLSGSTDGTNFLEVITNNATATLT